jgi:hypothetical protein
MNSKLTAYIKERCGSLALDPERGASDYLAFLEKQGASIKEYDFGFSTFRRVGDALVIADIYVLPEFRKVENQKCAWQIFYDLKEIALKEGLNLMIGFSEKGGEKKHLGERAMKAAGFQKVYETDAREIYMRGTN